jgi:acyl-CoA synthetase (NDP forming)
MEELINPRRVAVIGASPDRNKAGGMIYENLKRYDLELFPVNPKYRSMGGKSCYPTIRDIEEVDIAIICLPAEKVLGALEDCVEGGVKYVVAIAGGFSEVGNNWLEEELKEAVKGRGTRLLGPNTLGVYTPGVVDTMFLDTDRCRRPGKGQIALITQSGATATILMDSCSLYNIGFSAFVGIGNRADIGENELISHFSKDEDVRAIALYLESFADAKEFLEIAKSIDKPLVVLKAGRSEWGSRAALSHTGSLVRSSEKVVEGIFKQYGITRALDEIELIDYAKALAYSAPIHGDRIAILTSAGGPGVIAADYLKDWDLTLAKLEERTKNELKRIALPFASVENPVDLTASLTSSSWKRALEILAKAKEVDAILALTFLQPPGMDESSIDALKALKERKPIVSVSIGSEYTLKILKRCEELKIPAYPSIERGVKVLKILAERGKFLQR